MILLYRNFVAVTLVTVSILISGCSTTNKNYRDAAGVVKTDTRSAPGVNK